MSKKYSEIRSAFILRIIRKTSWYERTYVDDLILLDDLIDAPHRGFAGGVAFYNLRERYPREYLRLLAERGKVRLRAGVVELRARRKQRSAWATEYEDQQDRLREEWQRIGGKP